MSSENIATKIESEAPEPEDGEDGYRGRGRPRGSKDKEPRKQRPPGPNIQAEIRKQILAEKRVIREELRQEQVRNGGPPSTPSSPGEAPAAPKQMSEPEAMLFKMRWWLGRFADEQRKGPAADMGFMEKALDKACEAAKDSAPYHHARLSAMVVGASVTTKIEVVGGMSDDEFATEQAQLPAEILPGMVIEAEANGDADPDDKAAAG